MVIDALPAHLEVGEIYEQDFPSRPDYPAWLSQHDDEFMPGEYRAGPVESEAVGDEP